MLLIDEATPFYRIIEHVFDDLVIDRQLLLVDVALQLLNCDSIVEVLVDGVTQVANAVHGDLERLVALVQVLLGAGEVARIAQVSHSDLRKLVLSLNCVLIDKRDACNGFLCSHFLLYSFHNSILFPMGLLCSPSDLFLLHLYAMLSLSLLPQNIGHAARVVELKCQK